MEGLVAGAWIVMSDEAAVAAIDVGSAMTDARVERIRQSALVRQDVGDLYIKLYNAVGKADEARHLGGRGWPELQLPERSYANGVCLFENFWKAVKVKKV